MSFDCRYKSGKDYCRKRKDQCSPRSKDCVLYGRFTFAHQKEESTEQATRGDKEESGQKAKPATKTEE